MAELSNFEFFKQRCRLRAVRRHDLDGWMFYCYIVFNSGEIEVIRHSVFRLEELFEGEAPDNVFYFQGVWCDRYNYDYTNTFTEPEGGSYVDQDYNKSLTDTFPRHGYAPMAAGVEPYGTLCQCDDCLAIENGFFYIDTDTIRTCQCDAEYECPCGEWLCPLCVCMTYDAGFGLMRIINQYEAIADHVMEIKTLTDEQAFQMQLNLWYDYNHWVRGREENIDWEFIGRYGVVTLEPGIYTFECWGASGGMGFGSTGNRGLGAYVKGTLDLQVRTTFFLYAGQAGSSFTSTNNAFSNWNGGGIRIDPFHWGEMHTGGNGGGGTDIRLVGGDWDNLTSLRSRIIVAGGGGGEGPNCGLGPQTPGHGGTFEGSSAINQTPLGTECHGAIGGGGTQTSGGEGQFPLVHWLPAGASGMEPQPADYYRNQYPLPVVPYIWTHPGQYHVPPASYNAGEAAWTRATYPSVVSRRGRFGAGGNSNNCGAGAGGGYYGGGAAYGVSGGGGSSFVSGEVGCNAVDINGNHTGQPNHFSGLVFTDVEMIPGMWVGHGRIAITRIDDEDGGEIGDDHPDDIFRRRIVELPWRWDGRGNTSTHFQHGQQKDRYEHFLFEWRQMMLRFRERHNLDWKWTDDWV